MDFITCVNLFRYLRLWIAVSTAVATCVRVGLIFFMHNFTCKNVWRFPVFSSLNIHWNQHITRTRSQFKWILIFCFYTSSLCFYVLILLKAYHIYLDRSHIEMSFCYIQHWRVIKIFQTVHAHKNFNVDKNFKPYTHTKRAQRKFQRTQTNRLWKIACWHVCRVVHSQLLKKHHDIARDYSNVRECVVYLSLVAILAFCR